MREDREEFEKIMSYHTGISRKQIEANRFRDAYHYQFFNDMWKSWQQTGEYRNDNH